MNTTEALVISPLRLAPQNVDKSFSPPGELQLQQVNVRVMVFADGSWLIQTNSALDLAQEIVAAAMAEIAERLAPARTEWLRQLQGPVTILPDGSWRIENDADLKLGEELVADVGRAVDQARKTYFEPICDAMNRAHKQATSCRGTFFEFADRALRLLKEACTERRKESDRIRREQERKQTEEQARLARQQQEKEAKLLEKQGQTDLAAAVRATPAVTPAVVLPAPEKTKGTAYKPVWKWRYVVDKAMCVKVLPRDFVNGALLQHREALEQAINKVKDAYGPEGRKLPGVEFYPDLDMTRTGR